MKGMQGAIRIVGVSLLILQCVLFSKAEKQRAGGLLFNSMNHPEEERTSLDLTPQHPFLLQGRFLLSFELSFWRNTDMGTVFRMRSEAGECFDLLYLPSQNDTSILKLLRNGQETGIKLELNRKGLLRNNWMKLQFEFDLLDDCIRLYHDKALIQESSCDLPNTWKVNLVYGADHGAESQRMAVPRMSIKNVCIQEPNVDFKAFWSLDEIEGTESFDQQGKYRAKIQNPNWLLRRHYYWTKKASFYTDPMPGLAYDENRQRVLIVNSNHLIDFRVQDNSYYETYYERACPELTGYKYSLFNSQTGRLVTYGVDLKHVSLYDELNNEWTSIHFEESEEQNYWKHSAFFDPTGKRFITLGGYAAFNYSNSINAYSFDKKSWTKLQFKGDPLSPRCLSAVGSMEGTDEYLLFGGVGRDADDQDGQEHNLYDLFRLNLEKGTKSRIWELQPPEQSFVPVHSLVNDPQENCFFTLCSSKRFSKPKLELYRFSLDSAAYQIVSAPIPYEKKGELKSDADLYFNRQTNEFVAVTRTEVTPDSSRVEIYTMFYPVVDDLSVFAEPVSILVAYGPYILLLLIVLSLLFFLWRMLRRKSFVKGVERNTELAKEKEVDEIAVPMQHLIEQENSMDRIEQEWEIPTYRLPKSNAMQLFGEFRLLGDKQEELTEEFSPKRLQLFLILLLYPHFHDKGISSRKLTEILWPDHTPQSAKNNRGVNIRKLRSILESVDGMEIVFQGNRWYVQIEEPFVMDFLRYGELRENLLRKFDIHQLAEVLQLLEQGELLANVHYDWLDQQKSRMNDEAIDLLISMRTQLSIEANPRLSLMLANVLLKFDSVNDEALELKICALKLLGREEEAKETYESFAQEYFNLYQETYGSTWAELAGEVAVSHE